MRFMIEILYTKKETFRLLKETHFTRNRKMPLFDLSMINRKGLTLTMELSNFS